MPAALTGLFIIRAWIEEGSSEPLRAHIRLTTDVSSGFEDSMTRPCRRSPRCAKPLRPGSATCCLARPGPQRKGSGKSRRGGVTRSSRGCDAGPVTMMEPDSANDQ
jgi:hypothetical protein